jgi:hypothetical protein
MDFEIKFKKKRQEKCDGRRTVPCPKRVEERLKALDRTEDIHELTREFWNHVIQKYEAEQAS